MLGTAKHIKEIEMSSNNNQIINLMHIWDKKDEFFRVSSHTHISKSFLLTIILKNHSYQSIMLLFHFKIHS